MGPMLEHEVKLSAAEDFKLPDLSGLLGGVVPADRPDEQLSTLYLDSDDFRLARWDVSFRHREGQGWTVKIPGRSAGALLVRDEIVFPGSSQHPRPRPCRSSGDTCGARSCARRSACRRSAAGCDCSTPRGDSSPTSWMTP